MFDGFCERDCLRNSVRSYVDIYQYFIIQEKLTLCFYASVLLSLVPASLFSPMS